MRKKAARLTCAVARYMQPFGGFQYGQMAPADDAAEQSGGGRGGGGEMRPFSPALARPHSLAPWRSGARYSSWQPKICFPPPFRPLHLASPQPKEAPSLRPPPLCTGIEMKIRSGIHPSPFLFGPCFCTITFAFSPLAHSLFLSYAST